MTDPDLHPIGVLQCEMNCESLYPINFARVFVSPMNRAMLTCINMFKGHPNAKNIKFMVLPLCREVFHTSNDIP